MSNTDELEKRLKKYKEVNLYLHAKLKNVIFLAERAHEALDDERKWSSELLERLTEFIELDRKRHIKKNKKFYDFLFCNF